MNLNNSKILNLFDNLKDHSSKLIYQADKNVYVLFDHYRIVVNSNHSIVYRWRDDKEFTFSNTKHATAFVILDHYNKLSESIRVLELDLKITSAKTEKDIHLNIFKNGSGEQREINKHKAEYDLDRHRRFTYEIDKYITMAKTCQQRGFENELKRVSGK